MQRLKRVLAQIRMSARSSWEVAVQPLRMIQSAVLFFVLIIVLQWLFQPANFWSIITNPVLSISDRIDTIVGGFFAVFELIDDLTPIAFILIALFQTFAIVMWLELRVHASSKKSVKQVASLGLGLIGSGCVACGGSILSPLIAAVATGISISVAEALGDGILIIAVLFSIRAWISVGLQYSYESKRI